MKCLVVDIDLFEKMPSLKPDSGSHTFTRGQLPDSDKVWFCKKMSSELIARGELLAQEFHRLMNGAQPETRLACDGQGNYYVLSEEVVDGKRVPCDKPQRFSRGIYTGLGRILVCSVFLNEIDLNPGNLILNRSNQLLKLDGDWCFAHLLHPDLLKGQASEITSELLRTLPNLHGYFAYNWLDKRRFGNDYSSQMIDDELCMAPHFQIEINEAILKLLLLPELYIRAFINCYLTERQAQFFGEFLERRKALFNSAIQLDSFQTYLESPEAALVAEAHLNAMQSFTVNQRDFMTESEKQRFVVSEFEGLRADVRRRVRYSPDTVSVDFEKNFAGGVSNKYRMFSTKATEVQDTSKAFVRRSSTCSNLMGLTT